MSQLYVREPARDCVPECGLVHEATYHKATDGEVLRAAAQIREEQRARQLDKTTCAYGRPECTSCR